jgi:hypothetical protein
LDGGTGFDAAESVFDAGADAFLDDADMPDAPELYDAGPDAPDAPTAVCDEVCVAGSECEVAACVDGECVVDVAPAGTVRIPRIVIASIAPS